MANLPTTQGDSVYASKDGVYIYKDANIDSDKFGNFTTGGDISYSKGDFLGPYLGLNENGFYQITASRKVRVLPLMPKKTQTFKGWVLANQITTTSQESVDDAKKLADEEEYKKQLSAALGTDSGGTTTASGGTPTPTKSNTMFYVLGGLALLLGVVWLYMTHKKKPVVTATAVPPVNQPIKK